MGIILADCRLISVKACLLSQAPRSGGLDQFLDGALPGVVMVAPMGVTCMNMLVGMLVRERVSMLMQVDSILMLVLTAVHLAMDMLTRM
jgi:hypothetical protein